MRRSIESSFVQVTILSAFGAKPLPEAMLTHGLLDPKGTPMKFIYEWTTCLKKYLFQNKAS